MDQKIGNGSVSIHMGHEADSELYDRIIYGDSRRELRKLPDASIDLSLWSPPYYVGKSYEKGMNFEDWQALISDVIHAHSRLLKPGGFLAVNIGDILCFADPRIPGFKQTTYDESRVR